MNDRVNEVDELDVLASFTPVQRRYFQLKYAEAVNNKAAIGIDPEKPYSTMADMLKLEGMMHVFAVLAGLLAVSPDPTNKES